MGARRADGRAHGKGHAGAADVDLIRPPRLRLDHHPVVVRHGDRGLDVVDLRLAGRSWLHVVFVSSTLPSFQTSCARLGDARRECRQHQKPSVEPTEPTGSALWDASLSRRHESDSLEYEDGSKDGPLVTVIRKVPVP
jgi:hypothetical protein